MEPVSDCHAVLKGFLVKGASHLSHKILWRWHYDLDDSAPFPCVAAPVLCTPNVHVVTIAILVEPAGSILCFINWWY